MRTSSPRTVDTQSLPQVDELLVVPETLGPEETEGRPILLLYVAEDADGVPFPTPSLEGT
jgi:hypothetical protein